MKRNKYKFLIFGIMFILVLSCVSAWEWDNIQSYDAENKEYIITNALGLGNTIAKVKLDTPQNIRVFPGYVRIAEFTIENFNDYNNVFQNMEFYDINNGMKEFTRDYDLKYKVETIYQVEIIDYDKKDCWKEGVYNVCKKIGTHKEDRTRVEWKDLDKKVMLPRGEITIGVYLNAINDEKGEWIIKVFGERLTKWASWTTDLNTNLVAYWNLDETSGNLSEDGVSGVYNVTRNTEIVINSSGKIDYGISMTDGGNGTFASPIRIRTNNFTFCAWLNYDLLGQYTESGNAIGNTADFGGFTMGSSYDTANRFAIWIANGSGWSSVQDMKAPDVISTGTWYFVCATRDATNVTLYVNGTSRASETLGANYDIGNATEQEQFGHFNPTYVMNGKMDEVGYWNQSLTASQIEQLYNEGNGMTYYSYIPTVTLYSPINDTNQSSNEITFNYNCEDKTQVDNVTIWFSNGSSIATINGTDTNVTLSNTIGGWPDGTYYWNVTCINNESYQGNSSQWSFNIDITPPEVNITEPFETLNYWEAGDNLTINFTASGTNSDSCWYSWNNGTTNVSISACADLNFTTNITSLNNNSVTLYANDTFGHENSTMNSWIYNLFISNETYSQNTIEGATENFIINLNYQNNSFQSISSILSYNGTEYEGTTSRTGENILFNKQLIIPGVSTQETLQFYWTIGLYNGTWNYYNSTFKNQTVNILSIDNCSAYSTVIYNFTLFDEEMKTKITNSTIEIQFNMYDQNKNNLILNYSQLYNATNPAQICLNSTLTSGINYSAEVVVKYYANDSGKDYVVEYWNALNKRISNDTIPINVKLYDLNSEDSTPFQLTFRDSSYVLAPNILVYLYRQYVSDNDYKVVEIPLTDSNGQAILNMVRNEIIYNIIMVDNSGDIVATFNKVTAFCQDYTIGSCAIKLNAPSSTSPIYDYEEDLGISYTHPTYSETTGMVSFSFISSNLSSRDLEMNVLRNNQFGNRSVCSDSLTSTSGTLQCNVSSITSTDKFLFVNIDVDDSLLLMETINLESSSSGFGVVNGAFFSFLILLFLVTIFSEEKQILIISLVLGWATVLSIGLISGAIIGSLSGGIWLIICAIIMIWKLNREEAR